MYNTDKLQSGITDEYLNMFKEWTTRPIKLLEIGYLNGGFLNWVREVFADSSVYGIGIHPPISMPDKNIHLFQVDQNNIEGLIAFGKEHGNFDIICDDASHKEKETRNSFNCLWQFVNPGGWYVIEDWSIHYKYFEYGEMAKVISNIMIHKMKFGVNQIKIIDRAGCSLAFFQKNL